MALEGIVKVVALHLPELLDQRVELRAEEVDWAFRL